MPLPISEATIADYGLTAVPAASKSILPKPPSTTKPYPISSTSVPSTPLAKRIQAYAQEKLPRQTFHHSMRVYHFGLAIARQAFPEWNFSPGGKLEETFFLTAMLHDIGTTDEARASTVLSFELHGGLVALDILQHPSEGQLQAHAKAPKEQAESVAESIVRHQDIEERGAVSTLTQLIQLATIFDNAGQFGEYVHTETIESVNKEWPREKWLGCFAETVKKEMSEKPWCTTTRLGTEEFPRMILSNDLMKPYE